MRQQQQQQPAMATIVARNFGSRKFPFGRRLETYASVHEGFAKKPLGEKAEVYYWQHVST